MSGEPYVAAKLISSQTERGPFSSPSGSRASPRVPAVGHHPGIGPLGPSPWESRSTTRGYLRTAFERVTSFWNSMIPVSTWITWRNRLYCTRRIRESLSSTELIFPVKKYATPS